MQLLKAQCPYCGREVETTIEHITGPIVCPTCEKPFEMEIPTTTVTSVREVSDASNPSKLATQPEERTLLKVHPVLFRAHPIGTLLVFAVSVASLYGLWIALAKNSTSEQSPSPNGTTIGSIDWILWISIAALIGMALLVFSWFLRSASITLTLTNSRSILRKGLISRDSSVVQHDDVRNIQVDQTIFQRLLGIGDVGISSSGQDELEIIVNKVPAPTRIVEMIRENQR